MKSRLIAMLVGLSSLAIVASAAAHESYYRPSGGLSGGITISAGIPLQWGGVYGTLHYGQAYPVVPAYYPGGVFYRNCGHWHAPHYYGHHAGYSDYHGKHGKHHGKHKHHPGHGHHH